MAIEVKRKKDDDETKVAPMMDESFRRASLSSISLEERRKFESNLLRYGVLQNRVNPGEVEIGSPLVIPPYGPRTTETGEVRFMELDANGSNYVGLRAPDQCNGDNVWTLPGQDGASGMAMLTDGNHRLYFGWSGFWEKFGSNIGYTQGHISVNTTPNDDDGIIVKGGIYAFDDDESVYLKLVNKSDTAYDPVVQYAVGADPVIRWTHGLDDSLSNDWLLCAGDVLTDTVADEAYELDITYDAFILVCDNENNRIKKHVAADGTYSAEIGSDGSGDDQFNQPYGICSDGTYFYVADRGNNRIKKHVLATMAYDSKIGTTGSGDANFNVPYDTCTDGTYLYVVDQNNNRVKKHSCSDLGYVAETPSSGLNSPDVCCTDGTYLYVAQTSGATYRLFKFLCEDMSLVSRAIPTGSDGHIDSADISGMCYYDGYLYLLNANNNDPQVEVFKYSASTLAWTSDLINVSKGSGVGELSGPRKISTNGSFLYITDTGNDRISVFTIAGAYSRTFGTYGTSGDDQFNSPVGPCISGTIEKETVTPGRAPILRAKADGTALETYVSFQLRDEIRFLENSEANANYIAIQAPASVTSYSLVLPGTDSTGTQALVSNGSGTLFWSSMAHNILSASHSDSLTASVVKGDFIYGNATPKWARLAPNTTATKNFLTETSSVPAWGTIAAADLPAHQLDGAVHSVSGLTSGHFLKATGATTFAFGAHGLTASSVGAEPALGNPGTTGWVLSSTDAGVRSWIAPGGGAASFVDLDDVPAAYAGSGGYVVKVKADASGLEFVAGGAGVASFNDLDDVPASYVGQEGLFVRVNATADGLEYAAGGGGGAPTDAKYITQEVNAGLSAEQSLGALATGILKNTTTGSTGVLSIATAGTDYLTTAAPTDAKYIVGLANATLSAEKVKPQLYNNYDIDDTPASPNALDDEFDDSSLDVKWTIVNNPATRNWDETTFVGYLSSVIPETAVADVFDNYHRLYQATPAGDYAITIIAKVSLAFTGLATDDGEWGDVNIYFGNSTDDEWIGSAIQTNNVTTPAPHGTANVLWATGSEGGVSGVVGSMGTIDNQNVDLTSWVYLKLEKSTADAWTSANTYNAYYSKNGIVWHQVGTDSKTFSHAVDEIGILCRAPKAQTGDPIAYPAIDFFRRTV